LRWISLRCQASTVPGVTSRWARNTAGIHRASAARIARSALGLARAIGSPWDEAHALAGLGRCALAVGRTAEAEDKLRQALEIFQRIGAAESAGVAAELDALT